MKKTSSLKKYPKSPHSFKWWHIAVVIVMIAAMFFILEQMKSRYQKEPLVQPLPAESPVVKKAEDYLQKNYTAVRIFPARRPGHYPPKCLSGTLAVIVDDMGSNLNEVQEFLSINIPITFSIIPGLPKTKAVAEAAASAGREVMVHLPMEPQGYPKQRLESNGLLVSHSEEEIAARSADLINAIPHAKGANNHMGSRFTEHEVKMLPVLKVLKEKGLFFIDSRTTPKSTGYAVAERLGVKAATRNVFLDNQQDVAAIKKQFYSAAEMSRRRGGVIAICHPHAATIAVLKEVMPELQRAGIIFVSAGELVR